VGGGGGEKTEWYEEEEEEVCLLRGESAGAEPSVIRGSSTRGLILKKLAKGNRSRGTSVEGEICNAVS